MPKTMIPQQDELIYLGMDVSRDSIAVGTLRAAEESPDVTKVFNDEQSVRRLIATFDDPRRVVACYEAGPTGYDLARLLRGLGVRCQVVAPSLIPVAPGAKVKTDRRDALRLARLLRAGELTAIRVPTPAEEGVRDLCRARSALMADRRRSRQRLTAFLLRHGRVWRGASTWTMAHRDWLNATRFDDPALNATYQRYLAVATVREVDVDSVEADLEPWFTHRLFADAVSRLGAYRGIDRLAGLTLASEVCDWRRFSSAGGFMSFCGLVPSEYSSGDRTRRGHLTRAGNVHVRTQLVESAWAYNHPARLTKDIARRHDGVPAETIARAWTAQQRLCRRFRVLDERKNVRSVVNAAIARELAGFVWAEMTA
ncbi:MAG: IS110 family transposase [Actinomycetota bacterium]|nr:IS110 family transposase [Actinomycetota bacterium]